MGFRARREAVKAVHQEKREKAAEEAAQQRQEKINKYLNMSAAELDQEAVDALAQADDAHAHFDIYEAVYYGRANVLSQLATIAEKKEAKILPRARRDGAESSSGLYQQAVTQLVDADDAFAHLHVDSGIYFEKANVLSQRAMHAQNQESVVSGVALLIDRIGAPRG